MSSLTVTEFHHSLLKENKHQLLTNEKIDVLFLSNLFESLEKEKIMLFIILKNRSNEGSVEIHSIATLYPDDLKLSKQR